jgi:2-polyprenyl-3-methyl-5-hydroxy-6-metoxy-1,4-benzoquinol methylase
MTEGKRTEQMPPEQVQAGNQRWWKDNPMAYDWRGELAPARFSREWFDAIDERFLFGSRLFATRDRPFDRIMPLDALPGRRVLEIGCGMGLHTETMVRAGAVVTAVDLTSTAVEATTQRLALKGLEATVTQADAERLPFADERFDFVWSWGVIHHSARTARIVREIARVLAKPGSCRVMVYNRDAATTKIAFVKDHILGRGFLRGTFDETLYRTTDGFSARYYVREQFEDLFRAYFRDVESEICGQDVDAIPLPRQLRRLVVRVVPRAYLERAQARRGAFIFLKAANKE